MIEKDEFHDEGLSGLIKALSSASAPVGKIGVLGDKNARKDGASTSNAEVGAKHELGIDVTMRSWLRVPLIDHMQKYLEQSGAFTPRVARQVVKDGTVKPWLIKAMLVAEKIVSDGFASGGFGKWAPWHGTYTNNTGNILVDTTQLRNSVTSEVD